LRFAVHFFVHCFVHCFAPQLGQKV
jgi:hypothetical protein